MFTLAVCLVLTSTAALGQPTIIFHDDFEEGAFQPEWRLLPARQNGVVEVFPTTTMQGQFAARLGKSTDGEYALNRLDLPLDLSAYSDAELRVSLAHQYDDPHVQDGIYLSDNGRDFVKVFGFAFDAWLATGGVLPPLNLRALATRHNIKFTDQFVIRFQQYDNHDFTGGADFSDGLYLDEVSVQTVASSYASLPFWDDLEQGRLSEFWSTGTPFTSNAQPAIISPGGVVGVFLTDDSVQQHAVRLGGAADKQEVTNALDLRLNLAGQRDVTLSFRILNNHDETHPQDGIYFSDNGGSRFVKVYDFDFDHWVAGQFGQLPPLSVDELAQRAGLSLTDRFVFRFQQHGDHDFTGSRFTSDGYYLDDVRVASQPATYATLPFVEDFGGAALRPCWQWSAPHYPDQPTEVKPNGLVELAPVDSVRGRAVRLGSQADKCYVTNALDLHLNLLQAHEPELTFWLRDHYDETHPQDGIYFSDNGGATFSKVYAFDGHRWDDYVFGRHALNIRQLAAAHQRQLTDRFVIRFQQHDDDDFKGTRTNSDGFYLDDIRVDEPEVAYYNTLPFFETFEADSLGDCWRHGDLSTTAPAAAVLPGAMARVIDSLSYNGERALLLGKRTDGYPAVSAQDVCLNLARQSALVLSFWFCSNHDQTDPEDGIWLSDNGGRTFKKAYTFDHHQPGTYVPVQLNLDSLIAETNQYYTARFVVRFQQMGNRRADGPENYRHGVIIDDVAVSSPLVAEPVSQSNDSTASTNQ
jgi:hypothetical protein